MSETKINSPASRFEFVTLASARAHQLLRGCLPKTDGSAQPARRAQQEVAAGYVSRVDDEPTPEPVVTE
jgi:DNA-directed RNA polymerase subunit K/omega